MERIANMAKVDQRTVTKMSQQLMSLLTAYCEDTALSVVDSLKEHGPLGGLEAWRRLVQHWDSETTGRLMDETGRLMYPGKAKSMQE